MYQANALDLDTRILTQEPMHVIQHGLLLRKKYCKLLYMMSDIYVSVLYDHNMPYLPPQIMFRNRLIVSKVEYINVKLSLRTKEAGTHASTWHFVTLLLVM